MAAYLNSCVFVGTFRVDEPDGLSMPSIVLTDPTDGKEQVILLWLQAVGHHAPLHEGDTIGASGELRVNDGGELCLLVSQIRVTSPAEVTA